MSFQPEPKQLAERVLAGDRRALARAATWIEEGVPEGSALLRLLFPHTGKAAVFGITGPPGVGKSTLLGALAREVRQRGRSVGIIAVDPSSPFTGGALLGDRIRIQPTPGDAELFVRSMSTRGAVGGLAATTAEIAQLLDAAGFDIVLVETVGAGQDEIDIALLAEVTVLVLAPGAGDGVQAIKAGIMEIADIFALNKADLPGADRLEQEIRAAVVPADSGRAPFPAILSTVATTGAGIAELWQEMEARRTSALRTPRRAEVCRRRLVEMLRRRVPEILPSEEWEIAARAVAERRRDPQGIVDEWMARLSNRSPGHRR